MVKIDPKNTKLARKIQPMPDEIRTRLSKSGVLKDFYKRPDYQQNDYLAWVGRAKRSTTRDKRIKQIIDELRSGGVYMNMDHAASRKDAH